MIRLAFLGVVLIAGLLAFGAFSLMRNTGGTASDPVVAQADPAPVEQTEAPEDDADPYYFLRELDLTSEGIALVLFNAGDARETLVVRDQAALAAAQQTASIAPNVPASSFAHSQTEGTLSGALLHVYRNDELVDYIVCPNTNCATLADAMEVDYAGLRDVATTAQPVDDSFDSYADYLATIDAITADPNFMFLDLRNDAPRPEQEESLIVDLPSIVIPAGSAFDPAIHSALLDGAIAPLLPDGTTLSATSITPLDPIVLGDRDNNRPVLSQGAPVAFDAVQLHAVEVTITGTADLDAATLTALTDATRQQVDWARDFDTFVATRVQTDCADCLIPLLDDGFVDFAEISQSNAATYPLSYYDLREAP